MMKIKLVAIVTLLMIASFSVAGTIPTVSGQTLYVASYPHVYVNQKKHDFPISVTLNIRNMSDQTIQVLSVDYYDSDGSMLNQYIDKAVVLGELKSVRYLGVPVKVFKDSSGPYFIVKWTSKTPVIAPLVETLMIGASSTQGISFTHRADVLEER